MILCHAGPHEATAPRQGSSARRLTGLVRPTGSTRTEVAAPSGPDPHRLAPEVGEDTHA